MIVAAKVNKMRCLRVAIGLQSGDRLDAIGAVYTPGAVSD
jgi:hypothetical protein